MAVDPSKKTQADLDQEERDREAREARENASRQSNSNLFNQNTFSLNGMNDIMGMLSQFVKMIFGGGGLGGLFGTMGRSLSTGFSDFNDGLNGRGDTPLGPRGVKPNLGIGNSAGTTLRGGWDGVLDLIGKHESGGDYNRVYGAGVKRADLTNMTIDQVQEWQRKYVNAGSASSAVGKYQIISKTLAGLEKQMGLTGKEKFDEAMQDRMAMQLLENRGISKFTAGQMTTGQILNAISKEWASIENTSGKSAYAGDGLNRAAPGSGKQMAAALQLAANKDDSSRSSVARKIDTEAVATNEAPSIKSPKTPSAAAELSKVAAAGQSAPNDPVADRKMVKVANGAPMFVGSYGDGAAPKTQVAGVTPDLRLNPGPKV